jgi:hypothetical protein
MIVTRQQELQPSFGGLPLDIIQLIIFRDKETQFRILFVSKLFYQLAKSSLNQGFVGTSPLSRIEKPRVPFSFCLMGKPSNFSFSSINTTCIAELPNGKFVVGDNKGSFSLMNASQETVVQRAYGSLFGSAAIVATNKLAQDSWLTLSEDGLLIVWAEKNGKIEEMTRKQLEIKGTKLTSNCVATFDDGDMAIMFFKPVVGYVVYFTSIGEENNVIVKEVQCNPDFDAQHKIHKIHPSSEDKSIYVLSFYDKFPRYLPIFGKILKDGTVSSIKLAYPVGSDCDPHNYGASVCSSFSVYPLKGKSYLFAGFHLVSANSIEKNKAANYYLYSIVQEQYTLKLNPVDTGKLFQFNEYSFIRVLPNDRLFIKAGKTWTICEFTFSDHARLDGALSTSLNKIYSINRPEEEKAPIHSFHVTQSGDLVIGCGSNLFRWNLVGNELVVMNNNQDDLMLENKTSNSSRRY